MVALSISGKIVFCCSLSAINDDVVIQEIHFSTAMYCLQH